MQATKKQRSMANQTRKAIIGAAQTLFVAHGFAATSISDIAKLAEINQSLIYHHYGSKAGLWQKVKQHLLQGFTQEVESLFSANLPAEMFIEGYVSKRIHAAQVHPDIQRMLQWQRLESTAERLAEPDHDIPEKWLVAIKNLQTSGQVRDDLKPQTVIALLDGGVNGLVESSHFFIASEEEVQKSTRILIDMLKAGLSYHSFLVRRGPI